MGRPTSTKLHEMERATTGDGRAAVARVYGLHKLHKLHELQKLHKLEEKGKEELERKKLKKAGVFLRDFQ